MAKDRTKTTLVNFILDMSGSMELVKEATVSGFNEYVGGLKKDGNAYDFSLTMFDTILEKPYVSVPLKEVKTLDEKTYTPRGMTALYDAVMQTVKDVEAKMNPKSKSVVVIMTDGQENSSKEYTMANLKEAIDRLTKKGNWTFVFMGANQDSWATAQHFGMAQGNVIDYSSTNTGVRSAFVMMTTATSNLASSGADSTITFFNAAVDATTKHL